ncbi:AAA domain-containing protein [Paraoerskovia marina]|uniref:AAA domain-containing protein n=1 Tax=Paraoerskovia marina TaxID=545619 RepID=A0A1H1TJA2_9CELL|nr:(d)CMP kinase [Paraoerskovia marina]SDS60300.1 AAA domain-containing protein [Paraoerskovia marina]
MSVSTPVLDTLVDRVRDSVALLPRDLADPVRTRLVCIDGPAGSGKTTLAGQMAVALDAQVVHMDDLYEGWEAGPGGGATRCAQWVLGPLSEGRPGKYDRYDWDRGTFAESHRVESAPVLIVEGCGAAPRSVDAFAACVIWVEAPDDERLRRGLRRDGAAMRAEWIRWMSAEREFFAEHDTRRRAHVRLDGWGRLLP